MKQPVQSNYPETRGDKNLLRRLADYTEISTKIASVFPFFVTLGYCFFQGYVINVKGSALFFLAMLFFDMTVTMMNNYSEFCETKKRRYFSRPLMVALIICGAVFSACIGLYLSRVCGYAFFLAGVFCFGVGIAYSFGPAPISKSPYGELFSAFTMGFVLPFLVMTINAPPLAVFYIDRLDVIIRFDLPGMLRLVLVCAPLMLCIANIMLANNIRDMETDKNSRYTMARHIGRENAVRLFAALYGLVYPAIIAAVFLGAIPGFCLLVLVTVIPVFRNIRRFRNEQPKPEAFRLSIRNHIIILAPYTVCLFLGGVFAFFR